MPTKTCPRCGSLATPIVLLNANAQALSYVLQHASIWHRIMHRNAYVQAA